MNERIKEIAEQAGYHPDVYELCKPGMEKFAKLMVKECLGIYDKIDNGNQHLGTDDYPRAVVKHFDI